MCKIISAKIQIYKYISKYNRELFLKIHGHYMAYIMISQVPWALQSFKSLKPAQSAMWFLLRTLGTFEDLSFESY